MLDDPPHAKQTRFDFKETFEVLLGQSPNQHSFTVHRGRFSQRSKVLKAASSRQSSSGDQNPIELTEHDPGTFASYMQCVYFGNVTPPDLPDYAGTNPISGLIALYLLADKLGDVTTANLTIDEIIRLSEASKIIPSRRAIVLAYKSTSAGSPLRTLCRDYCVHEASYEYTEDLKKVELPREFLHDVILELKKIALRSGPRGQCKTHDDVFWVRCVSREKCHYHQHNKDHPKCS